MEMAPPRTLLNSPLRDSSAMSRRMVSSDTFNARLSSGSSTFWSDLILSRMYWKRSSFSMV
jgi:hypothetical protein